MTKYIDSEAFFKAINTLPYKDTSYPDASAYNGAISDVADMLTHFPAADVVEVRHGRWKHDGYDFPHGNDWVHCSVCGKRGINAPADLTPYCPHCGAIMDKEENE